MRSKAFTGTNSSGAEALEAFQVVAIDVLHHGEQRGGRAAGLLQRHCRERQQVVEVVRMGFNLGEPLEGRQLLPVQLGVVGAQLVELSGQSTAAWNLEGRNTSSTLLITLGIM